MVWNSSVFIVSTAWLIYQSQNMQGLGLTNKKSNVDISRFRSILVILEVWLRGLGYMKNSLR